MSDWICPTCNGLAEPGQRFCGYCGANLEVNPPVAAPRRENANLLVPEPGQREILIGRDEALRGTAHCWLNHPAVSLRHARVEERDGRWFVVDLNSSKGTYINYQRVAPTSEGMPISLHDTLWIAPYAFRLRLQGERQGLEQAHMRLDARRLVRTVNRGRVTILDLQDMALSFRPGEFIALVGGSGTGKTTLMKALNGLQPAQKGEVLIDDRPIIQNGDARRFAALYSIMGYVPQDDVMHEWLTAWEVLSYVARMRLAELGPDEIRACIEQTLADVDMVEHHHKRINQLSGGQRKRINIAMELLAQPRLLFLDEPTSGLDPGLDLEMMSLLRRWAHGNGDTVSASQAGSRSGDPKTIVLVTHATQNIEQCDYLAFMAPGGRLAFFGPPREAKAFFFPGQAPDQVTYAHIYRELAETRAGDGDKKPEQWADEYARSPYYERYVVARTSGAAGSDVIPTSRSLLGNKSALFSPNLRRAEFRQQASQFAVLSGRTARLIRRDALNAIFLLLQAPIVAVLLTAVSSAQALQPIGAVDAKKVLFILACAAVWLGIINATKEIVKEQPIYLRERLYGLGAAPYVLSRHFVLTVLGLAQVILLVLFVGWHIELPASGVFLPAPVEIGVTLLLSMAAGLALGLLISSLAKTLDLANTLMFLLLILQVIFSGLLFEPRGVAGAISALTLSRWSLEALGTTANLNQLLLGVIPGYEWDPAYRFTVSHLLQTWAVLSLYAIICLALTCWRQARKR
jgi:ABC-type multidrug transport system ATPase subunit